MSTIQCARCGATEQEESASFAEDGLVCARCHAGEVARDVDQMETALADAASFARGNRLDIGGSAARIDLASSHKTERVAEGPATPLHRTLQDRGPSCHRVEVHKTVSTPLGVRESVGYRETWTLRSTPAVQASFSSEGIGRKIVKLFKRELQVGDPAFDSIVYVGTDTRDATAAFLGDPGMRELIASIVAGGGWIRIEGAKIEGEVTWPAGEASTVGPDAIARVVTALI